MSTIELIEVIYKSLEAQAQLCTSSADVETAASVKIKIAEVVLILSHPKRTREQLGMIARLLRLENNLSFFLGRELQNELKELIRLKDQEENPDH